VPLTGRLLGLCAITADPHVRRPCHILISAFSEYRPWPPLHVYILTIKQVQLANMEPIPLDDPKNIWASSVKCYSSMGQSRFASTAKLFHTSGLYFTALPVERLVW